MQQGSSYPVRPTSIGVAVVLVCAVTGFLTTYLGINFSLKENHNQIPRQLIVEAKDSMGKVSKSVAYPVYNLSEFDTAVAYNPSNTGEAQHSSRSGFLVFHFNPAFLLWAALICFMMALAAAIFPVYAWLAVKHVLYYCVTNKQILVALFCTALIYVMIFIASACSRGVLKGDDIITVFNILFQTSNVVTAVIVTSVLLVSPVVLLIFFISPSADNITPPLTADIKTIEASLQKLRFLNNSLTSALYVLTVFVVFSVITTAQLSLSIKNTISVKGLDIFPHEATIVYGLYFSLFLSIVYFPTYFYLLSKEDYLKTLAVDAGMTEDRVAKVFTTTEGVRNSALDYLKIATVVLAPFISGLLPEGLKFSVK